MPIATFDEVRFAILYDGSLCDIYVLKSSIEEWGILLRWMSCQYALELLRDGIAVEFPDEVVAIFGYARSASVCLKASLGGGVQANAHFFSEDEVEFDLDRKELNGNTWKYVQAFIIGMSVNLDREVIFSDENNSENPIFRYYWKRDA